jgi:hypothetical protein
MCSAASLPFSVKSYQLSAISFQDSQCYVPTAFPGSPGLARGARCLLLSAYFQLLSADSRNKSALLARNLGLG